MTMMTTMMSKQRMALCMRAGAAGDDGVRSPSDSAESGRSWPPDRTRSPPQPLATSSSAATRRTEAVAEAEEAAETAISDGPSST